MANVAVAQEMQTIQSQLNDDNLALDEKLNLIDRLVELKSQAAESNSSSGNVNIAEDPALDLMCGDACQ